MNYEAIYIMHPEQVTSRHFTLELPIIVTLHFGYMIFAS